MSRLRNRKGPESSPRPQESTAPPLFGSTLEREALVDEAVELFSRKYGRMISREEARQMTGRLADFFKIVIEHNRGESPDKT